MASHAAFSVRARMVNQSRAVGACRQLIVLMANLYVNEGQYPASMSLGDLERLDPYYWRSIANELSAIEDYHAHLLRLDRASRFPGADDRSIDAHCLGLITTGAILIGAYVKGIMRAAAEIVPDRTARRADAAITIEDGFHDRGFERELTARIVNEARRHHINDLRVHEQTTSRSYRIPVLELHSYASP